MTTKMTRAKKKGASARSKALANVIGGMRGVAKKVVDKGGDFIANRIMLQPGIDKMEGEMADKKRMNNMKRREYIKNMEEMGY